MDELEKEVEYIPVWIEEKKRKEEVIRFSNMYQTFYEYLMTASENSSEVFHDCALKRDFDESLETWDQWEESNRRDYEDKKAIIKAFSMNDVQYLLDHKFENPSNQINDICKCIYLPLMKSDAPDDVVDLVFQIMYVCWTKLEGDSSLAERIVCEKLKDAVSERLLGDLIRKRNHNALMTEEDVKENRKKLRELPWERKSVDFTPFYQNNTLYDEWMLEKKKMTEIEKEMVDLSKSVREKIDEVVNYVSEYYSEKCVSDLKAEMESMKVEAEQAFRTMIKTRGCLLSMELKINKICDELTIAHKNYEKDWDRKKREESEEKKRKIEEDERKKNRKQTIKDIFKKLV